MYSVVWRSLPVVLSLLCVSITQASPLDKCAAEKLQSSQYAAQKNKQWVYVDFWASWCGPCRETFPFMNELQKEYKGKLNVLAISVDEKKSDALKFLKAFPADFNVSLDTTGVCPSAFKVKGMPSSYLISPEGKIVFTEVGFKKSSAKKVKTVIRKHVK